MQTIQLATIDYLILAIYFFFVLGIGVVLKRYMRTSADFLLSGRSMPAWVCGLAFISANLGALEVIGMAANGAKYGMLSCHFYWIPAIGAMVFLAIFMMPFYYGSKARSVPEYLKMRFDERVRCLNSISFAIMTMLTSGISMHVLADLLRQLLGWNYDLCLWVGSAIVLAYVFKGGLTSAIYTEVLQFFMIVLGFTPVVWLGLKDVGGWDRLMAVLGNVAQNPQRLNLSEHPYPANAWTSIWSVMGNAAHNPMGVDWFSLLYGLGFVLGFGYWCTNFLVIQRAMAAKNMSAARRVPLIAAVPKMFIPALVILPGMLAVVLAFTGKDGYQLPTKPIEPSAFERVIPAIRTAAAQHENDTAKISAAAGVKLHPDRIAALVRAVAAGPVSDAAIREQVQAAAENDYNNVMLSILKKYCPAGLLGLALTALMASFMSGMAGNVTAFNTIWTYDLYQAYLAPNRSDAHYMWMGRAATVAGTLVSIACAYIAKQYGNIMDMVQLVFGFVNAPLFATFLLGMFWKRTTSAGAFYGLLGGTLTSALFHGLTIARSNTPGLIKGAWLAPVQTFQSEMAQNFWLACYAFTICFLLTAVISLATARTKTDAELTGLVYSLTPKQKDAEQAWYLRPSIFGTALLIVCIALNIIFW